MVGIERHIGGAGAQHPEHGNDHPRRPLEAQGDPGLGAEPTGEQPPRQGRALPIQLAVGQLPVLERQGHCAGRPRRLLFEALDHGAGGRPDSGRVPLDHQLVARGGAEQLELGDRRPGVGRGGLEQSSETGLEAPDAGGVEQVGVVDPPAPELAGLLEHHQVQIEVAVLGAEHAHRLVATDLELRQPHRLEQRTVVDGKQHLEQGVAARIATRRQLVDQLLERQVLVVVGGDQGGLDPAQQLLESRRTRQVRAHRQSVDEEPDQALDVELVAAGDRRADHHLILPRVPPQQGLEGGQQQHVEGHALAPSEALQSGGQPAAQGEAQGGAAIGLDRRPRPIGGQVEGRQRPAVFGAAELPLPIGQLALVVRGRGPLPLPPGMVAVAGRQGRQPASPA